MPRISQEESNARRDQVIDACADLFVSNGYSDITMAQIAQSVTFGRANIYNYFRNKDEVFLALLQREHERWAADLRDIEHNVAHDGTGASGEDLADALAASLERRRAMLKLLATSIYEMEQFSSHESLVRMKLAYKENLVALRSLLHTAKPSWNKERIDRFVFSFMPFLHGLYPYAFHSDKQVSAMEEAGVPVFEVGIVDLVRNCASKLLQDD